MQFENTYFNIEQLENSEFLREAFKKYFMEEYEHVKSKRIEELKEAIIEKGCF